MSPDSTKFKRFEPDRKGEMLERSEGRWVRYWEVDAAIASAERNRQDRLQALEEKVKDVILDHDTGASPSCSMSYSACAKAIVELILKECK